MSKRDPRRIWLLAIPGLLILALVLVLVAQVPYGDALTFVIRGAAMYAFVTLFLSIVSSLYMVELVRFFGNPFLKVHHAVTITSLVLITLHPLGVAYQMGNLAVFIPDTGSWYGFFANGGRVAFWLFQIASLFAFRRAMVGRNWRYVHWLAYIAFLFATIHGQLLGINFVEPAVGYTAYAMAAAIVLIFVLRRLERRRRIAQARQRRPQRP